MKFILTKELGRLSKWLRILGFDASCFSEDKKSGLIIKALREDRIVLTRNSRLGQHTGIKRLDIKSDNVFEQLKEIMEELAIKPDKSLMFSRCTICNEVLGSIKKELVKNKVPKYVFESVKDFVFCPKCQKIYWQGSHWGKIEDALKEMQISV